MLNLLTKRASTLHLGPANYCWFTGPSRALCLKLAGTPTADRPLIGMCDSARCPQATPITPATGPSGQSTPNGPRPSSVNLAPRKTERARLQADYDRAMRVVTEIDAANTMDGDPA